MLQSVLTRKNLIAVSIAAFYAVVLVFTGVCLDGDTTMVSRRNPIALIAGEIGFKTISPGTMGLIALILVAFYTVVLVTALIYERRYAIVNNIKPTSGKMWAVYGGTFAACLVLSLGLGILIQNPLTGENIGNMLTFIFQSVSLSFFVFIALVIVIGALIMFIVNFINIDKPFKFFDDDRKPIFDDEDLTADVKASFDSEELEASMPGFGPGRAWRARSGRCRNPSERREWSRRWGKGAAGETGAAGPSRL